MEHRRPLSKRRFCYHVPQVKVVQVPGDLALEVAHSFQQDCREPVLGLLPALQRVEVGLMVDDVSTPSIYDAFELFITARQRAGCPSFIGACDYHSGQSCIVT